MFLPGLALDTIFVKVPHDDPYLKVHLAHSHGSQMVPVCTAVNQVGVPQLGTAPEEQLRDLFAHRAHRTPCRAVDLVRPGRCRQVTEAIAVKLVTTIGILVPHLEMDFRPPCGI